MIAKFGALLGALLLVGSCATVGVTSPYAKLGTKEVYEYRTFCGPRLPVTELPRLSDEKRAFLLATPAQDSIDMACKIHDVCYENYGHDNYFCDQAIIAYLQPITGHELVKLRDGDHEISKKMTNNIEQAIFWKDIKRNRSECLSLAWEVTSGIIAKSKTVHTPKHAGYAKAGQLAGMTLTSPLMVLNNNVTRFPEKPGLCRYLPAAEDSARYGAALQLLWAATSNDCGCKTKMIRSGVVELTKSSCQSQCVEVSMRTTSVQIDRLLGRQPLRDLFGDSTISDWERLGLLP